MDVRASPPPPTGPHEAAYPPACSATVGRTTHERPAPAIELPTDRDAEVVVLDGGTATALERAGHVLGDALWSARLLLDDPGAIVAVHREFLEVGAQVVTTASYQLAAATLGAAGRDIGGVERLLELAVALGRSAVDDHHADPGRVLRGRRALVAASVGPFGAVLADGSEYRGGYGRSEADLVAFHAPRIATLVAAGPDVLACETIPSSTELTALARILADIDLPAYVSATLGPDGTTTAEGQPLAEAFGPLLELDSVIAVGVNCCPPELVAPALATLAHVGRPLVAKPNLGSRWDTATARWQDADPTAIDPVAWVGAGARLVGGCCGTGPDDLRVLADQLNGTLPGQC